MEKRGIHWRQRNNIYTALEEVDLTFDLMEVEAIEEMWEGGIHLSDMARKIKRSPDEVALLLFDRALKGKITKRVGGVMGDIPPTSHLNSQIMGVMS